MKGESDGVTGESMTDIESKRSDNAKGKYGLESGYIAGIAGHTRYVQQFQVLIFVSNAVSVKILAECKKIPEKNKKITALGSVYVYLS